MDFDQYLETHDSHLLRPSLPDSRPRFITMVIVSPCLEVTRPLTKQLQASDMDVVKSVEKVSLLSSSLVKIRRDIDRNHNSWYSEAASLANLVGTVPCKPRTTFGQICRSNVPANSPREYFLRSVSLPFLDHLQFEISLRFAEKNLVIHDAFHGLPGHVISNPSWKEKFQAFLTYLSDD